MSTTFIMQHLGNSRHAFCFMKNTGASALIPYLCISLDNCVCTLLTESNIDLLFIPRDSSIPDFS